MKPQKSPRYSTELRVSRGGSLDENYFQVGRKVSTIKSLWNKSSQQRIVCHPQQSSHNFNKARCLSVHKMVSNCVQSTILSPFKIMKETKVREREVKPSHSASQEDFYFFIKWMAQTGSQPNPVTFSWMVKVHRVLMVGIQHLQGGEIEAKLLWPKCIALRGPREWADDPIHQWTNWMDGQTEQSTIGFHLHRNQLLSFLEDYKYYFRSSLCEARDCCSETLRHHQAC